MRIVSQGGQFSVDMDFCVLMLGIRSIYAAPIGSEKQIIGVYDDNQRALEVFDEIHEEYANENCLDDSEDVFGKRKVYYMPIE